MKYDYDDNGDIRSDQRVSLGYAQQLLSNGATPEQVGAIFGNSTLKDGLTTLDYAAGKLSDSEASDRAVAYLNELRAGQSAPSAGVRESSDIGLVINPNRDSPSGESIFGDLLSGGLGVIHGLNELYSNPLTEGLANLAYGASKVVLGGGPLKTVAYQLGKVAVSSSLDQGVAYLSSQAQTVASSYLSDLAARNGLSIDVTFAGQTHVLGAEQFGDVAGLLVGSVVNTVLGGAITGVTERAGQVSNVVKRGPKTDPTAPHNATIRAEAQRLKDQGHTILAGGGELPERLIPTPGGVKGGRRPDILSQSPEGEVRGRNIGRTMADGVTPVPREQDALGDLNIYGEIPTDFVPYNR